MEYVRGWGVVDNDGVLQISSDLREVLDVVTLVIIAALSEESMMNDFMDI